MFSFVRNSTFSALLCLGGMMVAPQLASAQTVQFELGQSGGRVTVRPDCSREAFRNDPRCRDHGRDNGGRGGNWGNDDEEYGRDYRSDRRRHCSPEQALDKAERMGLRRARIETVGRRFIEVSGRSERGRVTVTFARDRGCPIVRR